MRGLVLALGVAVGVGCSLIDTDNLAGPLENAPPDAEGAPDTGGLAEAGVRDADAGGARKPFCASRTPMANVVCEDFDWGDGGDGFLGWLPSKTGNGTLSLSEDAYSPPYALRATLPAGATYAQAYLMRSADLPRALKYRVSFMVRGQQPTADDTFFFSHVFFNGPPPKRYLATMLVAASSQRPFRAYLEEGTQGWSPDVEVNNPTAAPGFSGAWTPIELTFDFAAVPAKASFTVGGSRVEFKPIVETLDSPDMRLGLEVYNGNLDRPAEFFYDDFLFEALP